MGGRPGECLCTWAILEKRSLTSSLQFMYNCLDTGSPCEPWKRLNERRGGKSGSTYVRKVHGS